MVSHVDVGGVSVHSLVDVGLWASFSFWPCDKAALTGAHLGWAVMFGTQNRGWHHQEHLEWIIDWRCLVASLRQLGGFP